MFNRKEYNKQYRELHKEEISISKKKYRLLHRIEINKKAKIYREKNKNNLKKYMKEYYRNWRIKNKEKKKVYMKNYIKFYQKKTKYYIQYEQNRLKIDVNFKLIKYMRRRITLALKGNPKLSTTMNLVGCSIKQLKEHLQKQFKSGMNWSNYGSGCNGKGMQEWHIDHIKPCTSFDLSKPSEQKKCFHYTNLQPLWAEENRSKGDKI